MKNLISIVEIPATDLPRAVKFYQHILDITIETVEMGDTLMGVFPGDDDMVSVALLKGDGYNPSADGAIPYLYAGDDLQAALDRIEPGGGKILVPKTEITPEIGFFALFIDCEGNKLGLHSKH